MKLEWLEQFAMHEREKALAELVPGTQEFFYYRCLSLEHERRFNEMNDLLHTWEEQYPHSRLKNEMQNRHALQTMRANPGGAIAFLKKKLKLRFDHRRQTETSDPDLPSKLDNTRISRHTLKQKALQSRDHLRLFTDTALEWLMREPGLSDKQIDYLLTRVTRPDHEKLTQLVQQNLNRNQGDTFGAKPIHQMLLQSQLDKLARANQSLLSDQAFVETYLRRLQPNPDQEWQTDTTAKMEYIERLWEFVKNLKPVFNSLRATVLYHWLDIKRKCGEYNRAMFEKYLVIPKNSSYTESKYLKHKSDIVHWNTDHSAALPLPKVTDDEPLVRDYLTRFFINEADFSEKTAYEMFAETIDSHYLKHLYAQTKLAAGQGDAQTWYALLDNPSVLQTFRDKVEIEFSAQNPRNISAHETVRLELDIKNVPLLVIKVFEINTLNYYLLHGKPLDTGIDLDGLVAKEEFLHEFSEPPIRRVRRTFAFETLIKPGVYVIECIGNGLSSRALIQKGQLIAVERLGAAGHVFNVFDESFNPLPNACLWYGQVEYTADDSGEIVVPYSTEPKRANLLLKHGSLTCLHTFYHRSEQYTFTAGIHIDREQLRAGADAHIIVTPQLLINGEMAPVECLQKPVLRIATEDRQGAHSSMDFPDVTFSYDRDSVHTFKVPENIRRLQVTAGATVHSRSTGEQIELSDALDIKLNAIELTAQVSDLHLSKTGAGYVLYYLGKSGEPRINKPLFLTFQHRDFTDEIRIQLKTDSLGRVELGELTDIIKVGAASAAGEQSEWPLLADRYRYPAVMHARSASTIRIPYYDTDIQTVSLLEKCEQGYRKDCIEYASIADGFLNIAGLPPGDYDLSLKNAGRKIELRVTAGIRQGRWSLSQARHLRLTPPEPLQITEVRSTHSHLYLHLSGTTPSTRVHILGAFFLSPFDAFDSLARPSHPHVTALSHETPESHYQSGRDIGDEYRYVLERKYADKYPGNGLSRTGLLLNPWAIRSTDTDKADAVEGGAYESRPLRKESARRREATQQACEQENSSFANLDFLNTAPALYNIAAEKNGDIKIDLTPFKPCRFLCVLAQNRHNLLIRYIPLDEQPLYPKDLRLLRALDPASHFCERHDAAPFIPGDHVHIEDISTAKLEIVGTLKKVHNVYYALTKNETLNEFQFVTNWPGLSAEEKLKQYSKYACHELNFFLQRKDRAFFSKVIKPYLKNKRDKTFLDRYLLHHDLGDYLAPWAFHRLNILEQLLLLRRGGRGPDAARYITDLLDLNPIDREKERRLFNTVLAGSALDTADTLDYFAHQEAVLNDFNKSGESIQQMRSMAAPAAPSSKSVMSPPLEESAEIASASTDSWDEEIALVEEQRRDALTADRSRRFYRKMDKTQEFAENNYYRIPIKEQTHALITVNGFWKDFALHEGNSPFLSPRFTQATGNFSEMMCALAVLDLPFDSAQAEVKYDSARMDLTVKSESIVFRREINACRESARPLPILVSQNYLCASERMTYDGDRAMEKYVTGEFLVYTVYICQVVLTNPTSAYEKLDLLLQIPAGAMPVADGFYTQTEHIHLASYATHTVEYSFYFSEAGDYHHFPVQVTQGEQRIAGAAPTVLHAVAVAQSEDTQSWHSISQNGDTAQVMRYLQAHNPQRLAMDSIAWRMRDADFYRDFMQYMEQRCLYNHTLWSYAFFHEDFPRMGEWLQNQEEYIQTCGYALESDWFKIDPLRRCTYQHLEYLPLINARAHRLGGEISILNDALKRQYEAFLNVLTLRPRLTDEDWLAAAYHLFLQDRTAGALAAFDKVDRSRIGEKIQYDYMFIYAAFYRGNMDEAFVLAQTYQAFPVDRWRLLFNQAEKLLCEIKEQRSGGVVDEKDTQQQHQALADTQAFFDFRIEANRVRVDSRHIDEVQVNYYPMDIELLFSRRPFVQDEVSGFAVITPAHSESLTLTGPSTVFHIPEQYQRSNVVLELQGQGMRRFQANYAHELVIEMTPQYGRLRVLDSGDRKPVSAAYVKIFARYTQGDVKFYKDGYTDLRGIFDYVSLSTDAQDRVERFAILILTDSLGAVIKETEPPAI